MAREDAPLFLKIDVNYNDISNAYFAKRRARQGTGSYEGWAANCPISQAVKRQVGGTSIQTSLDGVYVDGIRYVAPSVSAYIKNVDATIDNTTAGIEPQTFYLKRA